VAVNDSTVSLSQAAAPCAFAVSHGSGAVGGASGGSLTFQLNTIAGCSWPTSVESSWINVTGGLNSSGSGAIQLVTGVNSVAARAGSVTDVTLTGDSTVAACDIG
jgi:hypothetical protein